MKDGFIRVAAATPDIKVADPVYNAEQVWEMMEEGNAKGAIIDVLGIVADATAVALPCIPGGAGAAIKSAS